MHKVHKIMLGISIALVIVGFVCNIIAAVTVSVTTYVTPLIVYILILYYTFFCYKNPHGNMLKFLMLFFSASLITRMLVEFSLMNTVSLVFIPLSMIFIAYIAGRLDRINENRFYVVIVLLLLLYVSFATVSSTSTMNLKVYEYVAIFEPCIAWIAIIAAYFARYIEHKLAGLQDKPYRKKEPLD